MPTWVLTEGFQVLVVLITDHVPVIRWVLVHLGPAARAAVCSRRWFFQDLGGEAAFWKNPEKIWSNFAKIQQNSGKFCEILEKKKKQKKIQQF